MKGEPHLVARAEQVAEAGLPLDTELMDTPWSARCPPASGFRSQQCQPMNAVTT
jgi:hypothetical protein